MHVHLLTASYLYYYLVYKKPLTVSLAISLLLADAMRRGHKVAAQVEVLIHRRDRLAPLQVAGVGHLHRPMDQVEPQGAALPHGGCKVGLVQAMAAAPLGLVFEPLEPRLHELGQGSVDGYDGAFLLERGID